MKTARGRLLFLLVLAVVALVFAKLLRVDRYVVRKVMHAQSEQRRMAVLEDPLIRRVFIGAYPAIDPRPYYDPEGGTVIDNTGAVRIVSDLVVDQHLRISCGGKTEYYAMGISNRNGIRLHIPDKSDRRVLLEDRNRDGAWDYLQLDVSGVRTIDFGADGTYDVQYCYTNRMADLRVRVGLQWYDCDESMGSACVSIGTQRVQVVFTNGAYQFANDRIEDTGDGVIEADDTRGSLEDVR